jgi:hypothetical protein
VRAAGPRHARAGMALFRAINFVLQSTCRQADNAWRDRARCPESVEES